MTKIYYGWFVLVGTFLASLSFGFFFSFGVFYTPLLNEFGWSKTQTASVVSLATILFAFGGIGTGALTDRIGARKVFALGAALMALGVGLSSTATSIWHFYLFYGLLAGGAWAIIGTVPLIVAVKWFTKRRALATGITTSGAGTGSTLLPYLSAYLIGFSGWRNALVAMAVIFAVILTLAAIIAKDPPKRSESEGSETVGNAPEVWTFKESLRAPAMWLLSLIFLFPALGLFIIYTYVPALSLARGVTPIVAAGAVSILGALSIAGRIGSYLLVRKLGTVRSQTIATSVMGLSPLLLVTYFSMPSLYLFALTYGLSYGMWIALMPALTADLFGRHNYGQIWGVINAGGGVGGLIGPIAAGLFLDLGGFDLLILLLVGGSTCMATILCLLLKRPKHRQAVLQQAA